MSNVILGVIIGLLLGLAIAYGSQIAKVYKNKDKISATSDLLDDVSTFREAFKF